MREDDPCYALAAEENMRVVGTAISLSRRLQMRLNEMFVTNLPQMRTAVEGAAVDYSKNAAENVKKTAAELGEAVMTQYVAQILENTKPIKWSVYDLGGSIQVYVWRWSRKLSNLEGLDNILKEGVIGSA